MAVAAVPAQRADVRIRNIFDDAAAVLLAGAAALIVAADAGAGAIHKCVGNGTTYQAQPCDNGATEVAVIASSPTRGTAIDVAPHASTEQFSGGARTAIVRSARWLPFRRTTVATGMTDDEVLNTPAGGVPTRIVRSRDGRTWREVWIYASRGGAVRELAFTNGRLTSITADGESAQPLRVATVGH